jgi:hypothetical protein
MKIIFKENCNVLPYFPIRPYRIKQSWSFGLQVQDDECLVGNLMILLDVAVKLISAFWVRLLY